MIFRFSGRGARRARDVRGGFSNGVDVANAVAGCHTVFHLISTTLPRDRTTTRSSTSKPMSSAPCGFQRRRGAKGSDGSSSSRPAAPSMALPGAFRASRITRPHPAVPTASASWPSKSTGTSITGSTGWMTASAPGQPLWRPPAGGYSPGRGHGVPAQGAAKRWRSGATGRDFIHAGDVADGRKAMTHDGLDADPPGKPGFRSPSDTQDTLGRSGLEKYLPTKAPSRTADMTPRRANPGSCHRRPENLSPASPRGRGNRRRRACGAADAAPAGAGRRPRGAGARCGPGSGPAR